MKQCLRNKCRDLAVWQLLLGWNHKPTWLYVSLSFVLLFYNILRFLLTQRVNALRDAEELADQQTPKLGPNLWSALNLFNLWDWKAFKGEESKESKKDKDAPKNYFRWLWYRFNKRRNEMATSYLWLWPLRKATQALLFIGIISFLVHMATWLFETVLVPV